MSLDPILVEGVHAQAAIEAGGDVQRMMNIFVQEGAAARAVPVPIQFSLAGRSVDAARMKRGGAVKRLRGKSQPPSVCAMHNSGIEHPAPTSVSGGDSKTKPIRKYRHHAR